MLKLSSTEKEIRAAIKISGSKSESNRLLILKALFADLELKNLSDSDDTFVLEQALSSTEKTIDIGHAGTAMRFLTAYFAFQKGEKILTGSKRMQERPIKILVEALQSLGADIEYLNKEGFPPLKIRGIEKPITNKVSLRANISSQYISALILMAASFPKGLEIILEGEILSRPYIKMTLDLLKEIGIQNTFVSNKISISPFTSVSKKIVNIESDWSSASYFYSLAALAERAEIELTNFKKNSLQGDSIGSEIFKQFGVQTVFKNNQTLLIQKNKHNKIPEKIELDLSHYPDIAQTLAVTCLGLGISFKFSGLSTLRIKETDRLEALKKELSKFGMRVYIKNDTLAGEAVSAMVSGIEIETYQDHRMAMAFAPLALKTDLIIRNPEVVSKSFPSFWKTLEKCGIDLKTNT